MLATAALVLSWAATPAFAQRPTEEDGVAALKQARVLRERGELAKAIESYTRSLQIAESIFGPAHVNLSIILPELAEAYKAAGQYAKAAPLYERNLKVREANYPADHVKVAFAQYALADVY